ncbi:hypothetical protein MTO96_008899 [Rhipicephalus appendiculatus]
MPTTSMRPAVLLVAASLCWSSGHGLRIDKSTGAYEDIVVAIHPSVEPDERIIENIKALFRSASTFLHRATRGLVHFGSVTIAVPDTWPARPHAKRTTASLFSVSDVRVAAENPQYGDTPYTLQPRGCGERGEYVHLTPRFLSEMNDSIADAYGSPAYLLVHEWAHFRYGVLDEYGDPESFRYPSLYCEFGMVRASACSSRIKFTASTETGEPCRIYKGCRVSTKCKAHFERSADNPVTSSIMFMPYLKGVTEFCDSVNKTHNIFAPNQHNHQCNRKSTWDVISGNEDFRELRPTNAGEGFDLKFTEVQKREGDLGRVIFALDVSGSMTGMEVGVVEFNETASVTSPLTSVQQESTREELVAKVRKLVADGYTCIGCSLRRSLKMLSDNGQTAAGSVIILMTDGEENRHPYIDEVLNELVAAQVVVNTIAFGTEAEEKLEKLARKTGGKAFAVRDGQSDVAVALESAFLDSAFALLDDFKRPVVIFEQVAKVTDKRQFSILVDADLGNETTVAVHFKGSTAFSVELLYPDGNVCEGCQKSVFAVTGGYKTFKVPGVAKPGTWMLAVSCNHSTCDADVHVRVTSLARDPAEEPVLARAFLKRTEVSTVAEAAIYAEVTKGAHVVLHARVTATVVRPSSGDRVDIELFDNGLGADVTANDGIYSGYFTQFEGRKASGALPASQPSALASSGATPAAGDVNGIPLDQFKYVDEDIEQAEPRDLQSEKAPQFSRCVEGGSFRLAKEIKESGIPPGSIQDLKVEDTFVEDNGTHVVILSWTCPGGRMDSGNASRVELRGSSSMTSLVDDFDSALEVRDEASEDGNIASGAVGSRQRLRFSVPDELLSAERNDSQQQQQRGIYFAARVWNGAGVSSSVSNVAAITFERPPPLEAPSAIQGTPWWVVLASVLAAVLFVATVAAVATKVFDRRNKRKGITIVVA